MPRGKAAPTDTWALADQVREAAVKLTRTGASGDVIGADRADRERAAEGGDQMGLVPRCPECDASWGDGTTCDDYFHQMLAWEMDHPEYGREVHHLMVLCFHLQHPSRYSPRGLTWAQGLLVDFLERGVSPQYARRRDRMALDSRNRTWKMTGTPEAHGVYPHPVRWPMTAGDVTANGVDRYCDSVRAWAAAVLAALRASGNILLETVHPASRPR